MIKNAKDMKMPAIGIGTYKMTDNETEEMVRKALDLGYRHIDTAERYGNQKAVGEAIKESGVDRSDIFLTTKIWVTDLEPEDVHKHMNQCLEKLGVDNVDLLLIHYPNPDIPLEGTLNAMKELKQERKTRFIGVSNFTAGLLEKALEIAPEIVTNQVEMNPYFRHYGVLEFCQENDLILTAYSSLGHGRVLDDPVLKEVGNKYNISPAQTAISWLVQKDNVVPLIKTTSEKHLKENLEAVKVKLSEKDIERIDNIEQKEKSVGKDKEYAPWNRKLEDYKIRD